MGIGAAKGNDLNEVFANRPLKAKTNQDPARPVIDTGSEFFGQACLKIFEIKPFQDHYEPEFVLESQPADI